MKKRIFFSYTDNEPIENIKLIQAIKLHFSRLGNSTELIFREQQFAMQADEGKLISILSESDCNVLLLSVNYANEEACMKQLNVSMENKNSTFPILLSLFYWDEESAFEKIETKMLPSKNKPLETEPNINVALTNIVKLVANEGLGIKGSTIGGRGYYIIMAVIVFLLGIISTVWSYIYLSKILALLTMLMFLCIGAIVLIRIWKPTSISLFKF